jgi:hypothetical protein
MKRQEDGDPTSCSACRTAVLMPVYFHLWAVDEHKAASLEQRNARGRRRGEEGPAPGTAARWRGAGARLCGAVDRQRDARHGGAVDRRPRRPTRRRGEWSAAAAAVNGRPREEKAAARGEWSAAAAAVNGRPREEKAAARWKNRRRQR